jgi:NAD-dependent dihydropyrimidine dehydrogenase PreA subunit
MVKQKMYTRLTHQDQAVLLPSLTSFEPEVKVKTEELQQIKVARVADKSRGRVEIEADLCKGCLLCIEACPPEVLKEESVFNKMGYHPAYYAGSGCTGCGICFYVCPEPGTIRVYKRAKGN